MLSRPFSLNKIGCGALFSSLTSAPTSEKARMRVKISGPSISTAIFRAEVKKELCFFRGCRATFIHDSTKESEAEILCEGKTVQISRFLEWLESLSVEIASRKANFQGPNLVAYIRGAAEWEDYRGDLPTGFTTTDEAPSLGVGPADITVVEAQAMAGTDESV
jgi:hypothetical protein